MVKHMTSDELYLLLYENDYDKFVQNMEDVKSRLKYFGFSSDNWHDDIFVRKFDNIKSLV